MVDSVTRFAYEAALLEDFPTIRAGVAHAVRLRNGDSPPGLLEEFKSEQRASLDRLAATSISEIPSTAAWRRAFSRFGVKPTQYRVAAEALLRRLSKQGNIPSINTLVDIGNLVSIRYAMPVAVFDVAGIAGSLVVRFATGSETFTDLGSDGIVHPEAGEVIFVDDANEVSARRWCWRQSAQSATGPETVEALIVVEGHHESAAEDTGAALADLSSLLATYLAGSDTSTWLLSPERPESF